MSAEDERNGTTADEAPTPEPEVARLKAELEAALKRAEELTDRLKRSQADYENLEKRTARAVQEVRGVANETLLGALLPVLDDFDQALAALTGDAAEGVRMLHDNLWKVLSAAGLEVLSPEGEPFDPYDHEVVGQVNDEALSDGTVKEVAQKGYRYYRRLLRPAKVIVVKRGE